MQDPNLIQAIDKIFSLRSNLEDITLGLNIKNIFCPKKLYKFRTLSEYSISNVINNDIWFDNPVNMNDPYDCRFTWDNASDRHFISAEEYQNLFVNEPEEFDPEVFKYLSNNKVSYNEFLSKIKLKGVPLTFMKDYLEDNHSETISKFINIYLKSIYFCSFSEGFSSTLMWTHYSNNHYGFCIEYDSTDILQHNPYIHQLYPILYTNKLFNLNDLFYAERNLIVSKNYNNLYLNYPLIHKSYEWHYEKEWRVIYPCGFLSKSQNLPTPPISSILLGSNFFKPFNVKDQKVNSDTNYNLAVDLINHCMKKDIALKIMKHSLSTYSIEAIPISYDECFKLLSING